MMTILQDKLPGYFTNSQKTKVVFLYTMLIFFLTNVSYSKTITGEAEYRYSDNETFSQAKKRCRIEAIRIAVESFATYIESESIIEDFVTKKDLVIAKSLALVRDVKIVEKREDRTNSVIWYKVTGEIDEQKALAALKKASERDGDIKTSGLYYFGEGKHNNKRKADKKAIKNLVINIADDLQNQFADILPADEDLYDFTESIINTYKSSFYSCKKKIEGKVTIRHIKKSKLTMPRLFKELR